MFNRVKSVGDNRSFVTLILVAQEDEEIRKSLTVILGQQPARRKYELNKLILNMKAQSAPDDFVLAIDALLDDQVADAVYKVIREQ